MWFCVKCPDSETIKSGITWEAARQEESSWFLNKAPWSTLEVSFRERLGAANLTCCLSDKLYHVIRDRFVYTLMCPQNDLCSNTRAAYPISNEG